MTETLQKQVAVSCPKCREQLKLITKIFNPQTGRIVHLLGCKCGEKTLIPEMT
jgi:hypothetical protein